MTEPDVVTRAIPYEPPEREYQDTLLAFKDMQHASYIAAHVENDPLGPVNKIVTLIAGQRRIKSVLTPVPAGASVRLTNTIVPVGPVRVQWPGNIYSSKWQRAAYGWCVEINDRVVLTATDAECQPPMPPAPRIPLRRRMISAIRTQLRTAMDAIAKRFGYHRDSDCTGWGE